MTEMPDEIWAGLDQYNYPRIALSHSNVAVKYVRADLSPPMPDDVAEAVSFLESTIIYELQGATGIAIKTLVNHIRSRHAPSLKDGE